MKILVTGGTGFIGSHIVPKLVEAGYEVVNLSKLSFSSDKNLKELEGHNRYHPVKGNITNQEDVGTAIKGCGAVINFAAEASVDRSIEDAEPFVRTNFEGTYHVLEAARQENVKTLLQISSDEVYGEKLEGSSSEAASLWPSSPYASTKAAADLLAVTYHKTYGLPTIVLRCSNVFGPRQYPEKIIPLFTIKALRNEKLPIYGDGINVRDWLYVNDYCSAIITVLEKGRPGIYNVSSENEKTNLEVAKKILSVLSVHESLIEHVADRPGHDKRYAVDTTKIRALGWKPKHEFEEALRRTVLWYKENPKWWEPLMHRG